ncbi:MAG TPA: ATP-binding protein [Ktedonobacterales bacterium]|nr:ATP-binding protein [Ktedonobacterales bacterium]
MNNNIAAEPRIRPPSLRALPLLPALEKKFSALPLLYRVLFANSIVILIGATLGTSLATRLQGNSRPIVLVSFVVTGLLISVAINFVLLKLALYPLHRLRETMRQVQAGDLTQQAPVTGRDPDADQLAVAFNTMLSALEDLAKSRASQILHAQEEERKRIARELHDETSQVLTSLLISLKLLEETISGDETRKRIEDTRALAHQTLRAVRNLSIDLRPSALDDLGLLPALRWYMKEYQQKCDIQVEFSATGLKTRHSSEMETALYRIVQEALTNTAKHAHAHKAWVTVDENGQRVHVRIRDDGRGFDVPAVLKTPWQDRGLGLAGMMERASLLDGTVRIMSQPGSGTEVDVHIPLSTALNAEAATTAQADLAEQGNGPDTAVLPVWT